MSTRLNVCPNCGRLGAHVDLAEETTAFLARAVLHARLNTEIWHVRGRLCLHCEMPSLTVLPVGMGLPELRELLALPAIPLTICEKGDAQ